MCSELPGGRLAEIYGPRKVFGYATLGATVFTLLTPLAAKIHFVALILCRVLLGFCLVSEIIIIIIEKFMKLTKYRLIVRS